VADYTNNMTTIKNAINSLLWNADLGMYNDNDTTQGGNMQPLTNDMFVREGRRRSGREEA
jgi:neutral trehalase